MKIFNIKHNPILNYRSVISNTSIKKNQIILNEIGFYHHNKLPQKNTIICGSCGKIYDISNIDNGHSCVYCSDWFCKSRYCKQRYTIHMKICNMIDKYHDDIPAIYRLIIELSYYPKLYNQITNNYYNNFNVIFPKQYLNYLNKKVNLNNLNKLFGIIYTNQFESTYSILTELYDSTISGYFIPLKNAHLFNHNCKPNACFYVFGNRIIIKALQDIKKNEEITISYNGQDTLIHKHSIKNIFNFDCNCNNHENYILNEYVPPNDNWIKTIIEIEPCNLSQKIKQQTIFKFYKLKNLKKIKEYIKHFDNIKYIDTVCNQILRWLLQINNPIYIKYLISIVNLIEQKIINNRNKIKKLTNINYINDDNTLNCYYVRMMFDLKYKSIFKNKIKNIFGNFNYLSEFMIFANRKNKRNNCNLL